MASTEDPWVLVKRAVQQMVKNGDVMRTDRLKQVMLDLDPSFDEKKIGYSKFSRFVSEAASKGLLRLRRMENGQHEIIPEGEAPAQFLDFIHRCMEKEPSKRPKDAGAMRELLADTVSLPSISAFSIDSSSAIPRYRPPESSESLTPGRPIRQTNPPQSGPRMSIDEPSMHSRSISMERIRRRNRWRVAVIAFATAAVGLVVIIAVGSVTRKGSNDEAAAASSVVAEPAEEAPMEFAILELESNPSGVVYVDGEAYGQSPAAIELSPGSHLVSVTAADHREWSQEIDLAAGEHPDSGDLRIGLAHGRDVGDEPVSRQPVGDDLALRVVGDGDGVEPARLRRLGELRDRKQPVGRGGVGVEFGADVAEFDQPRRFAGREIELAAIFADFGGNPGQAEGAVDILLGLRRDRRDRALLGGRFLAVERVQAVLVQREILSRGAFAQAAHEHFHGWRRHEDRQRVLSEGRFQIKSSNDIHVEDRGSAFAPDPFDLAAQRAVEMAGIYFLPLHEGADLDQFLRGRGLVQECLDRDRRRSQEFSQAEFHHRDQHRTAEDQQQRRRVDEGAGRTANHYRRQYDAEGANQADECSQVQNPFLLSFGCSQCRLVLFGIG